LYHGDLWPGCYDDWILPERERLRQTFSEALERLIELLEYERDYPAAVRYTRRLLQHDPLHEATHRRLMRLYALSGDRAGVERVYQECAVLLQRELEVEPSPATREAYERLVSVVETISQRHNLPTPPTPLIGRESELVQIAKLLADPACRLLTLVGPGGIGKTRLALQAASAETGRYLHGVYFVPLTSLTSTEFLVSAIAATLNFSFHGPAEPKTQLLNYLREKEMFLTLDGFEHLLPASEAEEKDGSELLADILVSAPLVKILVTSRERLNLAGEWLLDIEGLSVPPQVLPLPSEGSVARLEAYSAVTLFAQAASRMQPGFSLSSQIQRDVTRICRLVEGMPLALELAAAWVRTLTCAEIAQEIEQKMGFLRRSVRHAPRRHESMEAVFDPSWKLLSTAEKRVFRQLSIWRALRPARTVAAVRRCQTSGDPPGTGGDAGPSWQLLSRISGASNTAVAGQPTKTGCGRSQGGD
jgi:predicted ATPase